MYSVNGLFILFILLLPSDLPPMAPLGFITRTADDNCPETLLTVPDAFPAGLIVCNPSPFIEEKGQFLFSLLAHSRHRHSSFLPSRRCRMQDSKIWSRFSIIFHILGQSKWAFLTSNIIRQGFYCLRAKTLFGRVSVSFLNNLSGLPPESGRMRIVRSPFQSLSSHESSFHSSCYAVTPQMGKPAVLPGSSFCAASHFPVDANIC